MRLKIRLALFGGFCLLASAFAANPPENDKPDSLLDQLSWLSGHWKGSALGGTTEEIWSPAEAGSMMCSFRLIVEGQVKFYEFVTITETPEGLDLRIKHFNADMTGWEEKNAYASFPFVEVEPDRVVFDGFVIERLTANTIRITVQIGDKPVPFTYERVS